MIKLSERPQSIPFAHPVLKTELRLDGNYLYCTVSKERFPVLTGIPRFCAQENYAKSFGFQWALFRELQIDENYGGHQSRSRFCAATNWNLNDLDNTNILEVGCGAGRFSRVILGSSRANLYAVDYSTAVDASLENNRDVSERLFLSQASIYDLPFNTNSFDKIFCFGVLQHTPSFQKSIGCLIDMAAAGGEIVVDFYPIRGWYTKIHSKYILRRILPKMSENRLLTLIEKNIDWMIKLSDLLRSLRLGFITRFIPVTDLNNLPRGLSLERRRAWAILDTFDGLSATYDNPQRIDDVANMFRTRGCEVTFAGYVTYDGGTAAVVRALKQPRTCRA
jgi:SAM-dependent methyltransferase